MNFPTPEQALREAVDRVVSAHSNYSSHYVTSEPELRDTALRTFGVSATEDELQEIVKRAARALRARGIGVRVY